MPGSAGSRSTTARSTRRRSFAVGEVAAALGLVADRRAATTTATRARTPRRTRACGSRPRSAAGIPGAGLGRRLARHSHDRSIDPDPRPADARARAAPAPTRAAPPGRARTTSASPSTCPKPRTLPRFHVWTLGCQMNRSDSEEMAGRLLAAGCEEAPIARDRRPRRHQHLRDPRGRRAEGHRAEGQLARLKAANPAMRVVLTGCSVREPDRAGLRRRYPAVDLFLRPDEEPELVDRLGLASAQAPIGAGGRRARRRRSAGRSSVSPTTCRRRAPGRSGRGPSRADRRSPPGCRSSTAATRRAPTASCRSAAGRSGAGRSTTSSTRRARWPPPAIAR